MEVYVGNTKLKSSEQDVKAFMNSALWEDVQAILRDWLSGIKDDLLTCENFNEVLLAQGRASAMMYFLTIPKTILDAMEYEKEISNES